MWQAITSMSTERLIVMGVFVVIALSIAVGGIRGLAALLWGPFTFGRFHGIEKVREAELRRVLLPASVRLLGFGIVLVAIGAGILLEIYVLPYVGGWAMAAVLLIAAGIGFILFFLVATILERREPPAGGQQ